MASKNGWSKSLTAKTEEKIEKAKEEAKKTETKKVKKAPEKSDWSKSLTDNQAEQKKIAQKAYEELEYNPQNRFLRSDGTLKNEGLNYQEIIDGARASGDTVLAEEAKEARFQKLFGSLDSARRYKEYNNGDYRESVRVPASRSLAWAEEQDRIKREKAYAEKSAKDAATEMMQASRRAKWVKDGVELSSVGDESSPNYDKDFAQKSSYVPYFKDPENPTWKEVIDYNSDRRLYDYINDVNGSREYAIKDAPRDSSIQGQGYEYMTLKEKMLFNYYYNTQSPEKAEEYLYTIKEDLAGRAAKQKFWENEDKTAKEFITGTGAEVSNVAEGLKNLFNYSDEYIPESVNKQFAKMVREDVHEKGKAAGVAYDFVTTAARMVPAMAAGTVANAVVPGSGAVVAPVLFGASAAGDAYQEKLNQGWSKGQARTYSNLVGVAEGGLQYLLGGISALGGKISGKTISTIAEKITNGAARAAFEIGAKGVSEGTEESLQVVLEPFIENIALGYMRNDITDVDLEEMAYSGFLGFLTGGLFEGAPVAATKAVNRLRGASATPHQSPAVTASPQGEASSEAPSSTVAGNAQGIKYKIVDIEGKKRVVVTTDITKGENAVDTPSKLKKFIKDKYDTIKQSVPGKENNVVQVTGKGAKEYAYSTYTQNLEGEMKWDKYRMADNIDEMIAGQIVSGYEDPMHPRKDDIVAFYRSPVEVQVGNRLYDTELVTGITADGAEKFYDVVNLNVKKGGEPYLTGSENLGKNRRQGSDSPDTSVPQNEVSVKREMVAEDTSSTASGPPSPQGEGLVSVVPGINGSTSAAQEFQRTRPRYYEVIDGISKRLGIAVVIDEDIEGADGYWEPGTKTMHISTNTNNPVQTIVKHELTHILEGNKEYGQLVSFMKEGMSKEWVSKRNAIEAKYKKINAYNAKNGLDIIEITDQSLDSETMAELAENMNVDSYIEKVASEKPGLIPTVRKFIREVIDRFKNVFSKKELTLWEQAEQKWKKALDEAVKSGTINSSGNIEYSVYDEFKTNVMQWAHHPDTKPGDVRVFNRRGREFVLLEATKDGFVELKAGKYKEVQARYERAQIRKDRSFYEHFDKVRAEQGRGNRTKRHDGRGGELGGNDDRSGRQIESERLQTDTARDNEHLRSGDKRESVKQYKLKDPAEQGENDYSKHAMTEGSMVNKYHNSLTKQEWVRYYDRVNEFDWDDTLKYEEFEFVMVINDKLIKSDYNQGKPTVTSVTLIRAGGPSIDVEEGVIYDEDTKRILEQIAEDRKLYNKGTDIDGAEIFKSERGTDARTSAVNGKEYSSNKDNEKTKRIYDPGKDVKYKLKDISDIFDEQSKDDVLAELLEVEKENRDIKALNDGLRAEIQATKDWKINPARVEEAVRTVKEAYESKVKIPEIASRVQEIFERLQENIESENFEQIYAESYMDLAQIGEKIAENAKGAQDTTLFDQYADLRKMVRDTSIRLSAQDRADVGDYNAFRKRNFGRMRLSQNTGMDVDSFYEELASEYPEWFDKEITHPADRLMRIEKVLDAIKPTVSGMSTEDTGRAIAAELLERLSKTSPSDDQTIVDHLKKGYVKYYRDKNEQVRTEYREKLEKYKNKIKDRYDRETLLRLVNEFSKMREDVGRYGLSEIMKGEELEAFYFEDIDLSALEEDFSADTQDDELAKEKADKIVTDLAQRMLTASEKENGVTLDEKKAEVREKIKQAHERQAEKKKEYLDKIERAINELDGMGISILEKGYTRDDGVKVMGKLELNRLGEAYEAEKRTLGDDFVPNARIENKIKRLDRKQIGDLDIADVQDLIEVMQAVKTAIRNENRLLSEEKNKKISQTAEKVRGEIKAGGEHKHGIKYLGNVYTSASLNPIRRARQMVGYARNSEFVKLIERLVAGEKKANQFKQNTSRTFEKLVASKEMKRFAGEKAEVIEVATEAGNIKITPAMRVALYLHNKNFDNLRHIFYGGIVIPDVELWKKGKYKQAYDDGQTVKLTRRDINKICKDMTAFEYEFAETASKWLSVTCKEAINETSNILLGYDVARVNNYMPISVNPDFTKTEVLVTNGTLEGMGMLKSREGGITPIHLMDIVKVIEKQNDLVSKYIGYAVPVRDLQAVYNQQSFGDSTKDTIRKTWGSVGQKYIVNLLKDLQGGREGEDFTKKLRSNYAGAVLTLNPKTAIGQVSGHTVIANTFGWGPTLKALGQRMTEADKNLRAKYTAEFWIREKGYASPEMSEFVESEGRFARYFNHLPKALDWLTLMDLVTTGKIWKTAEVYVNDEIAELKKKGRELPDWAEAESDAYYKRIAELHDKCMNDTQPVSGIMHKPEMLRTKNELVRNVAMFKSQTLQNFGMMFDAVGEFNAAKRSGDKNWIRETKIQMGRTFSSQIMSAAVFCTAGLVSSLLMARWDKYKDDEDELTKDSIMKGWALDFLGTFAGTAPGGDEVFNLINNIFGDEAWYGVDTTAVAMLSDTLGSFGRLWKKAEDASTEKDLRELIKPIKTLAGDFGKCLGVPADNIMKIFTAVEKNGLIAARRFFGADTTKIDWWLLRNRTPVSKKSEYGKFFIKTIKNAYYTADGEAKDKKYADIAEITKDLTRIFGDEWVEQYQDKARKEIYQAKYPEKEEPESKVDLEKGKLEAKSDVPAMSDAYIEEYGNSEITYDGKAYKLTREQTERYEAKIEEKTSAYYGKIIGENVNINEAFGGTEKHTKKTSEAKERKVYDYFYYLADSGEISEAEAESQYKKYLRGEIEVPVFDVYTSEYMTYEELSRTQRDSVIEQKKKELKKGEITKAEYDAWYKDFVDGKVTYQKQKIIYGNYLDLDDEMKAKVLDKIQSRAKSEAQEEMRSEVVGE